MSEKTRHINGIGEVIFRKSKRARFMNITVRPFEGVKVSVPMWMSFDNSEQILMEKGSWVSRHLEKMKEIEKQQTEFDENLLYKTRDHTLVLKKANRKTVSIRLSKGKINVTYPDKWKKDSKELQSAIRKGIGRALRKEANTYVPAKTKELAKKYGFAYNKLTMKNIKSRWGSCSNKNNINLNIHLMRLPNELIDYVILHELAHTVEHNHRKKFWDLLDAVTGGAKVLDRQLKKYRIGIY